MARPFRVLYLAAALSIALPASFSAGSGYSYGTDSDQEHGVSWAVVTDQGTSLSETDEFDSLEDLKAEFGPEFLYVRDGRDRYVIRDEELVARAERAQERMQKYGKEVGEAARAKVKAAFAGEEGTKRKTKSIEHTTRRLKEAAKDMKREIREILHDAIQRDLADRIG